VQYKRLHVTRKYPEYHGYASLYLSCPGEGSTQTAGWVKKRGDVRVKNNDTASDRYAEYKEEVKAEDPPQADCLPGRAFLSAR